MRSYPGKARPRDVTCGMYDPRVRPWYIAAATGPKEVVVLMDTSASTRGVRSLKIKRAVNSIVGARRNPRVDPRCLVAANLTPPPPDDVSTGTLGYQDKLSVIKFSDADLATPIGLEVEVQIGNQSTTGVMANFGRGMFHQASVRDLVVGASVTGMCPCERDKHEYCYVRERCTVVPRRALEILSIEPTLEG